LITNVIGSTKTLLTTQLFQARQPSEDVKKCG